MYKAVNVSEEIYKQLQRISTQLSQPKARIVASLIKDYSKSMEKKEKGKLQKFNKEMGAKIKALRFSKKIKVSTTNIDTDFSALANTDYMR